jgi:hypothetical protein
LEHIRRFISEDMRKVYIIRYRRRK